MHVVGKLASVSGTLVVCALPAVAQTTAQIPLQFDFLAPGARSMALGSAFTARADDATAAFTNPAGLVKLFEPELSFEVRYRRNETPFLTAGRISGTITGIGEDTIQGPVFGTSVDEGTVLSFASFVYTKKRLAVAVYRHQLVELQNAFLYRGVFERITFAGQSTDRAATCRSGANASSSPATARRWRIDSARATACRSAPASRATRSS